MVGVEEYTQVVVVAMVVELLEVALLLQLFLELVVVVMGFDGVADVAVVVVFVAVVVFVSMQHVLQWQPPDF